ncbi:MAG TPA: pilus assembly protein TadG, partial [Alphaproteobacteria bacterium]|nr:pilus assembly protein TadG [Alphaproteobacteria bacterium]
EDWTKAFVLMSDGVNTVPTTGSQFKSNYTAYGYLYEGRLGTTSGNNATTKQNQLTELVCTRMKDLDIRIYTILLMENNSATVNMMRNCATSPDLFFHTPSTEQLRTTFQIIANDLSNLRISK